jgi:hypothetical protein
MNVYYDLTQSPPTHDFVNFLVRVEHARIKAGADNLRIGFILGERFKSPRDFFYTPERRKWRVQNLLMPLARLLPSVVDTFIAESGEQVYSYLNHTEISKPVLNAPASALEIVDAYLVDKPLPISITLRDSEFERDRNSNKRQWAKVADFLKSQGATPIVIPDVEAEFAGRQTGIAAPHYMPAAFCPEIRLALYERCHQNLMTQTGPILIALYSDVPLMAYGLLIPEIQCCEESHLRRFRMSPDDDWGTRKKLSWAHDYANTVIADLEAECLSVT